MVKVTGDYTALYQREEPTPSGGPVTTYIKTFKLNDDVPLEGEVEAEVRRL